MQEKNDSLARTLERLSRCRRIEEVADALRSGVRAFTGAQGITLVLREGGLCHYFEEDAIGPLWKGRRFPIHACISGWCMLNKRQVAIADISTDPRIPQDAYAPTFVRALVLTPIRIQDPFGAIGTYWDRRHEASAEQLQTLQALANAASGVEIISSSRAESA